jgi:UDP-N-acetylmuramoyl-tripeptide--D-alanyl-D-alanine ligase
MAGMCSEIVTVGPEMRAALGSAVAAGFPKKNGRNFATSREAADFLKHDIKNGDIVLIKGSQSMRMERVVAELMRHPENRKRELVRQDDFWMKKA